MNGAKNFYNKWARQILTWAVVVLGSAFVFLFILYMERGESLQRSRGRAEVKITNASDNQDHFAKFTYEVDSNNKKMQKDIVELREKLEHSERARENLEKKLEDNSNKIDEEFKSVKESFSNSIKDAIVQGSNENNDNTSDSNKGCTILESDAEFAKVNNYDPYNTASYPASVSNIEATPRNANIHQQQEMMEVGRQKKPKLGFGLHTIDLEPSQNDVIPAGSIVKGVLLGGVVVSTATNASGDPEPLHIEITEGLDEPARWFFNKKMKCRVIGEGYGEISSERVRARLFKLSCVDRKTGKSTETAVNAIVRDESGINGIRGTVVSRNAALIRNAFVSGVLGGAANAFSQISGTPATYNPFTGNVSQTASGVSMLKQAGSQGVGNALDSIAKYSIKQAEATSPAIQVSAGRKVDIVFNSSAVIGSTKVEPNVRQKNLNIATQAANAAKDFYNMSDVGGGGFNNTLPMGGAVNQDGVQDAENFVSSFSGS